MRRIAYLSPLTPEASGIADYSVELVAGLRHRFEIELFSAVAGSLPQALSGLVARTYGRFPEAHRLRPYDVVLYHLGNNADYHAEIYRLLLKIPGIVVLHEYMLHHLIRGMSSASEYIEAMRYCYGTAGAATARQLIEQNDSPECWAYPMFERAVDASLGVIAHSEATRRRVLRSRPEMRVAVVPHHLSLEGLPTVDEGSRRALRRELGVPDRALILASFGWVGPAKRIDVVLRAFGRFRRRHPESVYVLAGGLSPHYRDLPEMLAGPLGEGVLVTGRLPLPRLLELMDLADIAINLRHPTGGETSGTCIRLLGLGKPVVVNTGDWFSDIPAGCCARIDPGRFEDEELVSVLDALASSASLRHDMGSAAARWTRSVHQLERSVEGYAEFIEETIREAPAAYHSVPPLAPYPPWDVPTALAVEIATAAADLGIRESDRELLPALAVTLEELGLTGR